MGQSLTPMPTLLACLFLLMPFSAWAEDGYQLWLRYLPQEADYRDQVRDLFGSVCVGERLSTTQKIAQRELQDGLSRLLSRQLPVTQKVEDGCILMGTPQSLPLLDTLGLPLEDLGPEAYLIRSVSIAGKATTVIAANSDSGVLYGVFGILRKVQAGESPEKLRKLEVKEVPRLALRVLNHWDNLDRSVERGYAGQSIWDWWRLPDFRDPRYTDYARANASIGINGTVLNNVNARAEILSAEYLLKVAALAEVFRPYGLRVYLSVRFSSPIELGGLQTADPLDPAVRAWWRDKAAEIYQLIPDFGGFLVKANSEGQPGPQDYGRSHADGANMLAEALEAHGGVVMWRAFVYSPANLEDRVKQAFSEFKPLDGQFANNVLVQVKNGPLDFQPREPFHPLFGAMPGTPLMMEFQVTQEYLGFSTHLAYLGTLWEEVLQADTYVQGNGSTVARVVDGSLQGQHLTGMAGVANIGTDRDWSGSIFGQANWYAFGQLAWNPDRAAQAIAEEWLRLTFSQDPDFVQAAADMMMRSREAVVDYMTPLGLAHLMATDHHYGPAPWVDNLDRPEWNPWYYHRASMEGIGLDRGSEGSQAVDQYAPPVAAAFSDLSRVPDQYLLWFHRLPWDYRMNSGQTLWQDLVAHYDRGVAAVLDMQTRWEALESYIDPERFEKTRAYLAIQVREARWWRDASLAYFMHQSGLELPSGVAPPEHLLDHYRSLQFPFAPGH